MPSARPFTLIIRPVAPFRIDFTVWHCAAAAAMPLTAGVAWPIGASWS